MSSRSGSTRKRHSVEQVRLRVLAKLDDIKEQKDAIMLAIDFVVTNVNDISHKAEVAAQQLLDERDRHKIFQHLPAIMSQLEGYFNELVILQYQLQGDDLEEIETSESESRVTSPPRVQRHLQGGYNPHTMDLTDKRLQMETASANIPPHTACNVETLCKGSLPSSFEPCKIIEEEPLRTIDYVPVESTEKRAMSSTDLPISSRGDSAETDKLCDMDTLPSDTLSKQLSEISSKHICETRSRRYSETCSNCPSDVSGKERSELLIKEPSTARGTKERSESEREASNSSDLTGTAAWRDGVASSDDGRSLPPSEPLQSQHGHHGPGITEHTKTTPICADQIRAVRKITVGSHGDHVPAHSKGAPLMECTVDNSSAEPHSWQTSLAYPEGASVGSDEAVSRENQSKPVEDVDVYVPPPPDTGQTSPADSESVESPHKPLPLKERSLPSDDKSTTSSKSSRRKKRNSKAKKVAELLKDVKNIAGDRPSIEAELKLHVDYGMGPEIPKMILKEMMIPEATVTEVIDPSFFWIQPQNPELDDMSDELMFYNSRLKSTDWGYSMTFEPKAGMIVCAKFTQDNAWFRAKILTVYLDKPKHDQGPDSDLPQYQLEVFYLDYGNREYLSVDRVRPLHPKFTKLPCYVFACALSETSPPSGNIWLPEICTDFANFTTRQPRFCANFVLQVTCPLMLVELYFSSQTAPGRRLPGEQISSIMYNMAEVMVTEQKARKCSSDVVVTAYLERMAILSSVSRAAQIKSHLDELELHRSLAPCRGSSHGALTDERKVETASQSNLNDQGEQGGTVHEETIKSSVEESQQEEKNEEEKLAKTIEDGKCELKKKEDGRSAKKKKVPTATLR